MNFYNQDLMDHYRYPRHRGTLVAPDFCSILHNPSCGDSITWQVCVENALVTQIAFEGKGCVISQATASLLAQHCLGKSLVVMSEFTQETVLALVCMELGPTRLKCALLPLEALQAGVSDYMQSIV